MNEFYKDHHITQMHSNGTTSYETFLAILPSPLVTYITILLETILVTYVTKQKIWRYLMNYVTLVLPVVLSMTVLSKYLKVVLIACIVIVLYLTLLVYNIRPSKSLVTYNKIKTNFLTNARSTINILSVTAILAVDFNIFPRYFAKTESFGYSLMDVGVGLFMYSNGIVAPEARGFTNSIKKSIKSTISLFILGIGRFISVRETDYNVPVSEYGVHWNFFITLAVTKIMCAVVLNFIKIQHTFVSAVVIILFHEILLQMFLKNFILMDIPRDNFITANKEGIVSCLGYVSIYLFSVNFGYCLHVKNQFKNVSFTFIIYSLMTLIASIILQNYFGISRKLANSAYCFWVLFLGIFMTGLYYSSQVFLESLFRGKLQGIHSPLVMEAVNYNGLPFFLIGNLLTGLINISLNTLTINDGFSLVILILYMFINCLVVTFLYCMDCKLRI